MPELPEVETIRRELHALLPLKIKEVIAGKYLDTFLDPKGLIKSLANSVLFDLERKGKYLFWHVHLSSKNKNTKYLLSHLGMSGRWLLHSDIAHLAAHTHLTLSLIPVSPADPTQLPLPIYLSYIDPRRFGKIALLSAQEFLIIKNNLGIDALSTELTTEYLSTIIEKYPRRSIKKILLDQHLIAGIGNYLASETLARAGIHPLRNGKDIKAVEIPKLKTALFRALTVSLRRQGVSFDGAYKNTHGEEGSALNKLVVFRQEYCGICKVNKVVKIFQDGRGSYFCPHCQK
ncbi:MAG: Fpg/Nei family DNA glycosylase [Oligoflexia bacterium]|nr:Fpg/Nei family DNA glycosylase [Oligoflexia bacterium]